MLAVLVPFIFVLCLFYGFVPVLGTIVLGFIVLHMISMYPIVALWFLGIFLLLIALSHLTKKVSNGKTV